MIEFLISILLAIAGFIIDLFIGITLSIIYTCFAQVEKFWEWINEEHKSKKKRKR